MTTISADFHKFGYASTKGASVVVHRDNSTYEHQVFRSMLGKGRVPYETEGMRGSRPGGPIAAAWAVTRVLGREGYLNRTAETLDLIDGVVAGIGRIDGVRLVSQPAVPLISYTSDEADIFAIAHGLGELGWAMHQDDFPLPVIRSLWPWGMRDHLDDYLRDLEATVGEVRAGAISTRAEASY